MGVVVRPRAGARWSQGFRPLGRARLLPSRREYIRLCSPTPVARAFLLGPILKNNTGEFKGDKQIVPGLKPRLQVVSSASSCPTASCPNKRCSVVPGRARVAWALARGVLNFELPHTTLRLASASAEPRWPPNAPGVAPSEVAAAPSLRLLPGRDSGVCVADRVH